MNKERTKVDLLFEKLKNHPVFSIIVFIGILIMALSTFTQSLDKLITIAEKRFFKDEPTVTGPPKKLDEEEGPMVGDPIISGTGEEKLLKIDDKNIDETKIAVLCQNSLECKNAVSQSAEISGAKTQEQKSIDGTQRGIRNIKTGDPVVSATQACKMHGMQYLDYETSPITLNCGSNYRLAWWVNEHDSFVSYNVAICENRRKEAILINRIRCVNAT